MSIEKLNPDSVKILAAVLFGVILMLMGTFVILGTQWVQPKSDWVFIGPVTTSQGGVIFLSASVILVMTFFSTLFVIKLNDVD